jgi:hypothetical protein
MSGSVARRNDQAVSGSVAPCVEVTATDRGSADLPGRRCRSQAEGSCPHGGRLNRRSGGRVVRHVTRLARPLLVIDSLTRPPGEHADVTLWFVLYGSQDMPQGCDEAEFRGLRWVSV